MAVAALDDTSLYAEFRRRCEGDLLPRGVRSCALIFFVLQTVLFIPADWIFFPEHFSTFLPTRLVLNVMLAVVYFWGAARIPMTSFVVGALSGGAVFLMMVDATGGSTSGYYAGLMLLAIGMGVLLPLSARTCLAVGGVLFLGYAALPLYNSDPIQWMTFVQNLFFLGAAVGEGVFACVYMDRLRFADFKQQRQLESARDELKELDRAKSRFSANVHHELRTPLTLILAPLDALRSGDFGFHSPEVRRNFDTMYSNGRRLLKMINDLLDLAKVESQKLTIRRVPIDLEGLVDDLLTGAQALAERKQVELTMQGFADLPQIHADPDGIEKVVVNLVGNALKFTEPGDSIRLIAEALDVGGVRIIVRDTGVGIPTEKVGGIFDRFAQVDSSATRRHEGTGIGLSLARELVELHGGRIWAESEGEGHGTDLIFELPIGEADASDAEEVLVDEQGDVLKLGQSLEAIESDLTFSDTQSETGEDLEESGVRWERRRSDRDEGQLADRTSAVDGPEVVIAEDNPDMRSLLRFLLGREYRVRTARNGREALELVREREPSLVLSDVMMPEMSGIDLCREIKADPDLEGLPVVLVTSKAEGEMQIEGLEQGADDYVTKPFHPRELMARVRSLVARRELQNKIEEQRDSLERTMAELHQAEVRLVQAERLSAVGELAAGVAHEINNPVNFAVNAARALTSPVEDLLDIAQELEAGDDKRQEDLDELRATIAELVAIVTDGLSRTHAIVSKLRDFAAPSLSTHAAVDLERGLLSTLELLRHFLNERGVEASARIPENVPWVEGDAGALNQVSLNLIKNAAEAMEEGRGAIEIEIVPEGDTVKIMFRDDGPGLSEDAQRRLFEPFFTTKPEGEGTGLGLSISRQIAESHGGSLELIETSTAGACFCLELPTSNVGTRRPQRTGDRRRESNAT